MNLLKDLFWMLVVALLVVGILSSCKTIEKQIEVEIVKTDTLYKSITKTDTLWRTMATHDTLRVHDSVVVYLDTANQPKYKYVYRNVDKIVNKVDTLYKTVYVRDSTDHKAQVQQKDTTTVKEKPNPTTGLINAVIIGGVMFLVFYCISKIKN